MRVLIIEYHYPYEGSEIVDVCIDDIVEAAFAKELVSKYHDDNLRDSDLEWEFEKVYNLWTTTGYNNYTITEWEVEEKENDKP